MNKQNSWNHFLGMFLCLTIGLLLSCKADWPPINDQLLIKGKAFVVNRVVASGYRIQADTSVPATLGARVTVETPDGLALGETTVMDDQGNFELFIDPEQAGIIRGSIRLLYAALHNQNNQAIAGSPFLVDQTQPTPPPGVSASTTVEVQIDALHTFMMLVTRAAAAEHRDAVAVVQEVQRRTSDTNQLQSMTRMAENLIAATLDHPEEVNRLLQAPTQDETGNEILDNANQSATSAASTDQHPTITDAIRIAQEIINLVPVLPLQAGETPPPSGSIKVDVGINNGPNVLVTPSPSSH